MQFNTCATLMQRAARMMQEAANQHCASGRKTGTPLKQGSAFNQYGTIFLSAQC